MAHISRKELKQDRFRESLEHGAEAVVSHKQFTTLVIGLAVVIALGMFGWKLYKDRQDVRASAALDDAMKAYNAQVRAPGEPVEPGEPNYADDNTRLQDATRKFDEAATKYPRTNAGRLARYYEALSLEEMGRYNQAIESLRKIENSNDQKVADLTRFQMTEVYARTGKPDEAIKLLRQLAEHPTVLVPKPVVLLALAAQLQKTSLKDAVTIYNQITKDYPGSAASEKAQRVLDELPSKS